MTHPCVDCGTDSVATCQRCQARKCAAHYLVAVHTTISREIVATQASGNVVTLDPPDSWPRPALIAYASGGPGCVDCRSTCAKDASQAEFDRFSRLCADLGKKASRSIIDRVREGLELDHRDKTAVTQVTIALQGVFTQTRPNREAVRVQLGVPMRARFGQRRKGMPVSVIDRQPALLLQGGDWALTGDGRIHQTDAKFDRTHLLVKPGTMPTILYSRVTTVGENESGGPMVDRATTISLRTVPVDDLNIFLMLAPRALVRLAAEPGFH